MSPEEIVQRVAALVAENQRLLYPRLGEVGRWKRAGLSDRDAMALACAGERNAYLRLGATWPEIKTLLRLLDRTVPRWAAASDSDQDRFKQLAWVLRAIGYAVETPVAHGRSGGG